MVQMYTVASTRVLCLNISSDMYMFGRIEYVIKDRFSLPDPSAVILIATYSIWWIQSAFVLFVCEFNMRIYCICICICICLHMASRSFQNIIIHTCRVYTRVMHCKKRGKFEQLQCMNCTVKFSNNVDTRIGHPLYTGTVKC